MKWEYKGKKLANPFVILKRVVCYILMYMLAIPMYIVIWIGWGKHAANTMLGNLE